MGNIEGIPASTNDEEDLFHVLSAGGTKRARNKSHRRSQSLESLGLQPQRLEKKISQRSSFLSYVVKESSFATLAVDEDGNKMLNEYIILSNLGAGSYGKVKLCMHAKTEKPFVGIFPI